MFKAIREGKAGRVQLAEGGSTSWRELFRAREDLLTAGVFTRFSYLSSDLQRLLMKRLFPDYAEFGDLKNIAFWPRYELDENEQRQFVEPDLVLEFENINVLVEVKPPNGGVQYLAQWRREIQSYSASEDRKNPFLFLALGRIEEHEIKAWRSQLLEEGYSELLDLAGVKWQAVVDALIKLRTPDVDARDQRIMSDMLELLHYYGLKLATPVWSDFFSESTCRLDRGLLTPATLTQFEQSAHKAN